MRASPDVKRFAESLRMRDGVSQYSTTKIKDESTLLLTNNESPITAFRHTSPPADASFFSSRRTALFLQNHTSSVVLACKGSLRNSQRPQRCNFLSTTTRCVRCERHYFRSLYLVLPHFLSAHPSNDTNRPPQRPLLGMRAQTEDFKASWPSA